MIMHESSVFRGAKPWAKKRLLPTLTGCGLIFIAGATVAAAQSPPLDPPPSPGRELAPGPWVDDRLFTTPGRFEDIRRGTTVRGRFRPDYQPLGVRLGAFVASPVLAYEQQYDSNIFATDSDTVGDFIARIQPALRVQSDWANHLIGIDTGADIGVYFDNGNENYEDYYVSGFGRLDITRDANLAGRLGFHHTHEPRTSPDDAGGTEPTKIDVFSGVFQYDQRLGLFEITPELGYAQLNYKNVEAADGTIINQQDRDRHEWDIGLRVGYEFLRDYQAFVRGNYNFRRYDEDITGENFNRNSDGYGIVGGIRLDLGGLMFGDFFAGYRRQSYDASEFAPSSGPTVGGTVTWNVTPLTTIVGLLSREIVETTVQDAAGNFASGSFNTNVGLSVDHELLRNLILGANFGYINENFEGIDRVDNVYTVGVNATYLLNRHLYASAGYRFLTRNSDAPGEDFTRSVFLVRLQTQY